VISNNGNTPAPSFRDPGGRVFFVQNEVFRAVTGEASADFKCAIASPAVREFVSRGSMVRTSLVDPGSTGFTVSPPEMEKEAAVIARHERVPFASYPYEWSPEMLYAAAVLTLDLQESLVREGLGLKDASPYNILFNGPDPVFVDWLSVERRDEHDPVWLAQAQFTRTFLLPLLVNRHFGVSLSQIFLSERDGLEPEAVARLCGGPMKWRQPFRSLVTLPALLGKRGANGSIYQQKRLSDPEKARFILDHQISSLRRQLRRVAPDPARTSGWAEYVGPNQHFTDHYLQSKQDFITRTFEHKAPAKVLDIGCNTGFFSRLAAKFGASVVGIDLDPTAAGRVWQMSKAEQLSVLPLVVDISRPTPATGWINSENLSFLDRASGAEFDTVIMLAVIHHMLVTERIPLTEILKLAAELTRDRLIIEFVPPNDPMFRTLCRGRDELYRHLTREHFEDRIGEYFSVEKKEKLPDSDRWLYQLKK